MVRFPGLQAGLLWRRECPQGQGRHPSRNLPAGKPRRRHGYQYTADASLLPAKDLNVVWAVPHQNLISAAPIQKPVLIKPCARGIRGRPMPAECAGWFGCPLVWCCRRVPSWRRSRGWLRPYAR